MTAESMTMNRRKIGDMDCAIVDGPGCDEQIDAVAVICHGFGAPGEDLVPCAPQLYGAAESGLSNVRFVFPAAPIQMDPTGIYDSRAWWPLDMEKLQEIMQSGGTRDLRQDRPEMLDKRNQQLTDLIQAVVSEAGIGYQSVVLGGFSQGSMLATEVALALPETVGGLIVWSGTLLSEEVWTERAAGKSGLKVVQSHGRVDPILPFVGAELLRDMLTEHGVEVEYVAFDGQHSIPQAAIAKAAELIESVAKK